MSSPNNEEIQPKFTRGEKCIFAHLIVTFVLLLILVIYFFVHLCLVNHSNIEVWKTSIPSQKPAQTLKENIAVGVVYIDSPVGRVICNCLLVRQRWSLGPGHCAAVRSKPELSHMLPHWRIRYLTDATFVESAVKRSIVHPHFNADDFSNNVGLFHHEEDIFITEYFFINSLAIKDDTLIEHTNNLAVVTWDLESWNNSDSHVVVEYAVHPLIFEKCKQFTSPVVDVRKYEFCVTPISRKETFNVVHGAALLLDKKLAGFFSWGDTQAKGVPFIIVGHNYFLTWIEDIVSL